jgi:hypothetical protein
MVVEIVPSLCWSEFSKRINDSIQKTEYYKGANQSQTYYLRSKLIQTEKMTSIYVTRVLDFENNKKERSLIKLQKYIMTFFN